MKIFDKRFDNKKAMACVSLAFAFACVEPAHGVVVNCYDYLGFDATGRNLSEDQRSRLQHTDILNNPKDFGCFTAAASIIGERAYDFLSRFWNQHIKNCSQKQDETFVLSREQARERGLDFFSHPYYQTSSALNGVVASRIFRHFLPASPLAYLIISDDADGEREILGLATEPLEMVSLGYCNADAYNRRVKGDRSMDKISLSFKNVEEWYALTMYLRLPTFNMVAIGILNGTQDVVSIGYEGAFQAKVYPFNEDHCLTSDSFLTLAPYPFDRDKVEAMERKIVEEKEAIKGIVDDTYASFYGLLSDESLHSYKRSVYNALGFK